MLRTCAKIKNSLRSDSFILAHNAKFQALRYSKSPANAETGTRISAAVFFGTVGLKKQKQQKQPEKQKPETAWGCDVGGRGGAVGSWMRILTFAGILEYLSGRDFALCTKRTLSER